MITPSNALFKTNAMASSKTVRVRFVDRAPVSAINFASDNDLQSVEYQNIGGILSTGMKSIKAKVLMTTVNYALSNEHIYGVYLDILRPNTTTWDSVRLGEFTVHDVAVDIDANTAVLTLYDDMYTASQTPYSLPDSFFTGGKTIQQIAEEVATKLGMTLASNFNTLPNYNFSTTENIWANISNTSYRDVLREIAEATGTTCIVRYDDTTPSNTPILSFVKYTLNAEVMTKANLIKFKIGDRWGSMNQITASRMPQNDNILKGNQTNIDANGLFNYSIINNQLIDDDRATVVNNLYSSLITATPFFKMDEITLETEGHGWYEIGDVFTATLNAVNYYPFVVEHTMSIAGGITEKIVSVIPTFEEINRQTAGGVIKHIYNTEIKVDKQQQEITSIVSDLATLDGETTANFASQTIQINNIINTIQATGGGNLLKNSVGYAKDGTTITNWTATGAGTVTTQISTDSLNYGALSGNQINFVGAKNLKQTIPVTIGKSYSISFYALKASVGTAQIKLSNAIDTFTVNLLVSTAYAWQEFSIQNIVPSMNYFDVEIITNTDVTTFYITDFMITNGNVKQKWQQANGEILNTNVTIDADGIAVKSNVYDSIMRITPTQVSAKNVAGNDTYFAINGQTTQVKDLSIAGNGFFPTMRIIPITTGAQAGLAFVKID